MKPAPFEMHRPVTIEDALNLLSENSETAKLLAGGQSLVPLMNLRMATPGVVIDLGKIGSLRGVQMARDKIVIGAMTRQAELLANPLIASHAPLLHLAAAHVGHLQTRARGTVGGSLAHADPAAELPVAMVALDAEFALQSVRGERRVAARRFFKSALETELAGDEILREIAVPIAPASARACFREYARRHGDFAIVSAAIQFAGPGTLAVALGGVTEAPHLCTGLAASLTGGKYDTARLAEWIGAELTGVEPLSDIQASGEYRRHLASVLLDDGLREVLSR